MNAPSRYLSHIEIVHRPEEAPELVGRVRLASVFRPDDPGAVAPFRKAWPSSRPNQRRPRAASLARTVVRRRSQRCRQN